MTHFKIEEVRSWHSETVHGTRLRGYHNASVNRTAILFHVLSSETGLLVSRSLKLIEQHGKLFVVVRWKSLSSEENNIEPLKRIYDDVPQPTTQFIKQKKYTFPSACKS